MNTEETKPEPVNQTEIKVLVEIKRSKDYNTNNLLKQEVSSGGLLTTKQETEKTLLAIKEIYDKVKARLEEIYEEPEPESHDLDSDNPLL